MGRGCKHFMLHWESNLFLQKFKYNSLWDLLFEKTKCFLFQSFDCKYFVLNTKGNLGKFDLKSFEATFVGYFNTSKAYKVFNKSTLTIEEPMHVKFEESNSLEKNIVEIDFLGENFEKNFMKDLPA